MAIDRITYGADLAQRPHGARQLGARVKPIIRLGMGHKHPEKGYPVKDDHFTIRGDERVIAKFKSVYGDTPKAVKIMVPSSLALALDISYRSFVGGGDGDGRPLALGMTNFATLGYVGGPDVLRVWKQDGTYAEVETQGLDETGKPLDEIAADLKIKVHATLTATLPDVLGWGSFFQITSQGKKSADNLAFKLTEIYSAFGSRAPWAFTKEDPPMLVIKPDTQLTRFEKDGKASWGKTNIYVLDIVIPEDIWDMQERLLERKRELDGNGGPVAALYGPNGETFTATPAPPADAPSNGGGQQAGGGGSDPSHTSGAAAVTAPGSAEEDGVWEPVDDEGPSEDDIAAAAQTLVPAGVHQGRTFEQVAADENGPAWFLTQLKKVPETAPARQAIEVFVRGRLPETWARYEAWKAEQS